MTAIRLLVDLTIKVSFVVGFALAATALVRKRSAAFRHWVLSAAIVCAAATPALGLFVPAWHLALSPRTAVESSGELIAGDATLGQDPAASGAQPQRASAFRVSTLMPALGPVWIAGAAVSLLILLVGLGRLAWLASHAQPVRQGRWAGIAEDLSRQFDLRRPIRLLQSEHPTLLVTWGTLRPNVMLPRTAHDWPEDRIRVVLGHELAHIRRHDWAVQMAAEILRAVFWFDPLLSILCWRLRQESEQACDDAVLNLGVEGPEYAAHLVGVARDFKKHDHLWLPAAAMARPSSLERRVRAMLNVRLDREPITRSACLVAAIALLSITLPIAGFVVSAQDAFATLSGTVTDPFGKIMPNATLMLSDVRSSAKHEVRTDQGGRYEFVGLPAGDYSLETQTAGFATLKEKLSLSAQPTQHDLTLQVGQIQETIRLVGKAFDNSAPPVQSARPPVERSTRPDPCSASPVGGCLRPPTKLRDVKPFYPQAQRDAKIQGLVVLAGFINAEGFMTGIRTVGSPDPGLASAAIDAVSQWEFDATHLDGVPIDTRISINVTFILQ